MVGLFSFVAVHGSQCGAKAGEFVFLLSFYWRKGYTVRLLSFVEGLYEPCVLIGLNMNEASPISAAPTVSVPATTTSTTAPAPAPEAQQAAPGGFSMGGFLPIIIIFAIFYFMMIRPQQRKEKQRQKMISELRAGRKITFAGGLIGTIVEAKEQTFIVQLSPNATVEVARGAVAAVIDEPEQK